MSHLDEQAHCKYCGAAEDTAKLWKLKCSGGRHNFNHDRRIQSVGRNLSPTYVAGYDTLRQTKQQFDDASKKSMDLINAKHGKPTGIEVVRLVDSHLQVHNTVVR